jgi:amidase
MGNLIGLPGVTVPVGCTAAGLPFCIQVVTPFLHERRALRIAKLAAEVLDGYAVPPEFRD